MLLIYSIPIHSLVFFSLNLHPLHFLTQILGMKHFLTILTFFSLLLPFLFYFSQVFWLCARAMELLPKLYERSQEQLRQSHRIVQQLQARSNNGGASSSSGSINSSSNPAVKCQAVLALGWQASLLEDSAFLGKVKALSLYLCTKPDWFVLETLMELRK